MKKKQETFDVAHWLYELTKDTPRLVTYAAGALCAFIIAWLVLAILWSGVTPLPRYGEDMTGTRIGIVIGSGIFGFVLGWLFSPKSKLFRKIAALVLFVLAVFYVIYDHGMLGWSSASILGWAAFSIGFGHWIRRAVKRFVAPPTTFGDSHWAESKEVQGYGLLNGVGIQLGQFVDQNKTNTIRYAGDRHLITIAPNRSGKGTTAIIPNLLSYQGSMLVIDPKGENAMVTAERRAAMGQDVYVVDPFGITGFESAGFNPLDWLVNGDVDIAENAMILADALIVAVNTKDSFWDEEAKAVLQGFILYVATDEREDGHRHLGRVRDLTLLDGDDLKALFGRMIESPHHSVKSTGARCLQKDEKLLANVMASLQSHMHFLDSSRLRDNLSHSDFKFEDLKTKPMTVYLVLPSDRLDSFGRWLRLLIQQSLTVNARNIETKPDLPVLYILDEMAALGRLAMVEKAFGLMAGYGIQLWGIVQDCSQLRRIYGDGWETFIANAGAIQYFGSRDKMTADYFSALCGVTTVWNFSTAVSRAFGQSSGQGGLSTSDSTTNSETTSAVQRQLAYPDQLMRMHESKQLLLVENLNPIAGQKLPWFKDSVLKDLGRNLHDSSE